MFLKKIFWSNFNLKSLITCELIHNEITLSVYDKNNNVPKDTIINNLKLFSSIFKKLVITKKIIVVKIFRRIVKKNINEWQQATNCKYFK